MKSTVLFKVIVILPAVLFADYIAMIILGCSACIFTPEEEFYCGPFCFVGKIVLVLSALFFLVLFVPDIKKVLRQKKDGQTTKKQESQYSTGNERV